MRAKAGASCLIDLRRVAKIYAGEAGEFHALKGVDFKIYAGEFVAVVGKSGCGKSTLLNMVTGIDRPTSGEVWVGRAPLHTYSENQMAVWRGRNIGIVFQFFQLIPTLSALENVMLPMDFCNSYKPSQRVERARELLRMVDLEDHGRKLPAALSGGQQQRVAIARSLANDPPILMADEPTGNLDSKTADNVFSLFIRLSEQGKTIMMVTHDTDLAGRAGRSVVMADGEIVGLTDNRPLTGAGDAGKPLC